MVTRPGSYLCVRVLLLPWTKNGNQKSKKYCRCDFGLLAPSLRWVVNWSNNMPFLGSFFMTDLWVGQRVAKNS